MLRQIVQRGLFAIAMLFAVSLAIFAVTEGLPTDLPALILGPQATPESAATLGSELDLDSPAHERFLVWIGDAAQGDLGRSLTSRRPVADLIAPRLANTLFLVIYAAAIAVPIAVLLGVLTVIRRNHAFDKVVRIGTVAVISTPEFLIGLLLVLCLSAQLAWFPTLSSIKPEVGLFSKFYTAFLPMLTLILVVTAHVARSTREALQSELDMPYAKVAMLKGLTGRRIVMHHALPNALASVVRSLGASVGYLIAGVVVVEVTFSFNGLGRLLVDAVAKHDIPLAQGCGLVFAVVFLGLNLVAEVFAILCASRLPQHQ